MNECAGNWVSSITWERRRRNPVPNPKPESDGNIHIDSHGSSPAFTGEHRPPHGGPSNPLFSTQCNSLSGNMFHIIFRRRDTSLGFVEVFKFEGIGEIDPVTGEGRIHEGRVDVVGGPPELGDTGTWESTRQGGVGDEDDKDRKDKDHDRGGMSAG